MLTINRLCCFRLHTAGVIIGWVGAALSFVNIILHAVILARIDQIVKFIIDQQGADPAISEETLITVTTAIVAICLTLAVVNLVSCFLLIAGTMQERHLMLVPWLINNGIVLLVGVVNFVSLIWFSIANGAPFGSVLGVSVLTGLALGIQYLIWTAIYSLFRLIRSSREQQQLIPNKAAAAYPSYTRI